MPDILIINGSARLNGDTQKFINKLTEGIACDHLILLEHYFLPYNYDNQYPQEDQFETFAKEILFHKHIIFATPVYWYSMSGRMKNLFDRLTDWVTTNKDVGRNLKGKTMKLIAVGTDGELPDGFITPFSMTANYMEMIFKGHQYFNSNDAISEEELAEIKKSFFSFISE
ncbi:NADPH-dependent oxidoreductase [Pedobacter frigidisoli]|uniref:NADPH-dependent oxidoreductase n=1 Tax=Pedobacter frigidisoli TaxID=2530455 RepID=A0A4R0NJ74_9SPHI|nr:NAD(P)H-dependent oxidoreductase [Pedobacter frigidisoli]TCD00750.1 NADPH-dependent oxidoreductase [Pedobacter frigidisoli]